MKTIKLFSFSTLFIIGFITGVSGYIRASEAEQRCKSDKFLAKNFSWHMFKDRDFSGYRFMRSIFIGAHFEKAKLVGTNFNDAQLSHAYFMQAHLENALLKSTTCIKTHFDYAILVGANLYEACFKNASFVGANLTEADLRRADFCEANLNKVVGLDDPKTKVFGAIFMIGQPGLTYELLVSLKERGAIIRTMVVKKKHIKSPRRCRTPRTRSVTASAVKPEGSMSESDSDVPLFF